jgi:hypothetical protein
VSFFYRVGAENRTLLNYTKRPSTMNGQSLAASSNTPGPLTTLAVVAVLMIGLIGGLFYHHETARKMVACAYLACAYCHAGSLLPASNAGGRTSQLF